jgi:hypothetical protein
VLGFTPLQRSRCSPPGLAGGTACVPIHSTIFCGSSSCSKIVLGAPMVISWAASVVTALLGLFGRLGRIVVGHVVPAQRPVVATRYPWPDFNLRRLGDSARRDASSPEIADGYRRGVRYALEKLALESSVNYRFGNLSQFLHRVRSTIPLRPPRCSILPAAACVAVWRSFYGNCL